MVSLFPLLIVNPDFYPLQRRDTVSKDLTRQTYCAVLGARIHFQVLGFSDFLGFSFESFFRGLELLGSQTFSGFQVCKCF